MRWFSKTISILKDWARCEPNPISDFGAGAKITLLHLLGMAAWCALAVVAWLASWPLGVLLSLFILLVPFPIHLASIAVGWERARAESRMDWQERQAYEAEKQFRAEETFQKVCASVLCAMIIIAIGALFKIGWSLF